MAACGLPRIAVLTDKRISGANNLADEVPPLRILPFADAFQTCHTTDAHFVAYEAVNTGGTVWPRLNKPILPKLRIKGADVQLSCIVLDYDNPNHEVWSSGMLADWLANLTRVAGEWPCAWDWALMYTTKRGARLVYVLDHPVTPERFEGHHQWLCQEFNRHGIAIDITVSDWTRLFRLPCVMRDGEASWMSREFTLYEQFDNRIASDDMGMAERVKGSVYAEVKPFTEGQPDYDYAYSLIHAVNPTTNRMGATEFFREAKKRLKGRDCFPCLFEDKPLAEKGSRDTTLHAFLGQAISLLFYTTGCTASHIYGLFLPPVEQLENDSQTPDWKRVLWNHIGRLWSKEQAKAEAVAREEEARAEQAVSLIDQIVTGVREWCDHPKMRTDNPQAIEFVTKHFIVGCNNTYHVMRPDGRYDPLGLLPQHIIPRIRALGMDALIEIRRPGEDGTWKEVPLTKIMGEHCTIVSGTKGRPSLKGAFIEQIDKEGAQLVLPLYRRNEQLEPTFDADVDTWLQALFGDEYPRASEWIAWSLAFEEGPICAISIEGSPGSGKKMFIKGLAECLESPALATARDLVGEHQYGLMTSPFLIVNEGWPGGNRGMHPADQFRHLVGGDPIPVARKYLAPVHISSPVRIIFTANNNEVIRMLTGNRDLSPDDREALIIRLLHFSIGERASIWLRRKGGMHLTGKPGRRWIGGDGDDKTDYVVAKHFLWLYHHKRNRRGVRFLVEGNNNNELMWEMRTRSGSSPLVIEAVLQMMESNTVRDGIAISDGELYVLASQVLSYFRSNMTETREKLTIAQINSVFKSLAKEIHQDAYSIEARKIMGRKRWHQLDCGLLQSVARRDGWASPKLDQLVMQQIERDRMPRQTVPM